MKLLLLLMTLVFSISSWAQKLELTATIMIEHEYDQLEDDDIQNLKNDGWRVKENSSGERVFVFKKIISYSNLNLKKEVGAGYFSIAPNGVVELGVDLDDSDSITTIHLPMINGKVVPLTAPMKIKNKAGEYASGIWSFEGELLLSPVK